MKGRVVDPSGAPIGGAQVSIVGRLGVVTQTTTTTAGTFELDSGNIAGIKLVVTATGFRTRSVAPESAESVMLEIAPLVDSVQVIGSAIDVAAAEQGGSVSLIPPEDVRRRNEPMAMDLLRYLPGITVNQTGMRGGLTSFYLRGGNANLNLVQIDGAPVNGFGGAFDFAHIPSEVLDHVEVIRGPQSAVYGSYANSGAINFVTRKPGAAPRLDLLAEGGTYRERRFGITGSGTLARFGVLASVSRLDADGPVANSDYTNQYLLLNVTRRFGRQSLSVHGGHNHNVLGTPGPWGSDPKGTFGGIDLISRGGNNFSDYTARYEADLSEHWRAEAFGSFFLNNSGYTSPYGFSYNKDLRGQGEARVIAGVNRHDTVAAGVAASREDVRNAYITDATFSAFPIRRRAVAVYTENRLELGGRFWMNGGLRVESIRTPEIPGDGLSRPRFPASTVTQANPKIAAAFIAATGTRAHASFGMGLRPPSGFELAFTNNPGLRPERTRSVDAGIEQRLFGDRIMLDATYFYNRYYDLIVTLQGELARLSSYQSDNLANSRAHGAEFTTNLRPARWIFLRGAYTLLKTRILSLDGASEQAPLPFTVGQPLTRRPRHTGNFVATFTRGRAAVDLTGSFRGRALFEEPSFGAGNGLFWGSGYAVFGLNLNYALGHGTTAYAHLRNALNRHYEEVLGYPAPRLNFVAGMKWSIGRRN